MAFKIYSPYIQRELVRAGMPRPEALRAVVDEKPEALRSFGRGSKRASRNYSRSPAWHKFNVTAAYPKIIDGNTIMINPLVTSGHNADFDGDTMNIHVPGLLKLLTMLRINYYHLKCFSLSRKENKLFQLLHKN